MNDLLIRGGTVIDGTGAPRSIADVLIHRGHIVRVGDASAEPALRTIEAAGQVVAPGFIDIHAHSDEAMFLNDALESALHMGVTLVVNGNCGGSSAPVYGCAASDLDRDLSRSNLVRSWATFAEYADAVERARPAINVCSFVGHGTLRSSVMGPVARAPSGKELAAMRELLRQALLEGAVGLSSGLIYPPSAFADAAELASLCAEVRSLDRLYASHIRNEGAGLLEAVEENLEIGRRSGVRVQLSHHKAAGEGNWGLVERSTALIERARAQGQDVAADQYPYTASSTGLSVVIPNWVHEGGPSAMCLRLADPVILGRIATEETETGRAWERIVIARARQRPDWAGRSVADLAGAAGKDPLSWVAEALILHEGAVDIIHHSMDEGDVRLVMAKPWVCIGSDSRANAPYGPLSFGKPHPRSYGTFPRVLGRYVREVGLFSLEEAVRKMTTLPASRLHLEGRGVVRAGAWADLVIFDPDLIGDVATYDDPHRYPTGTLQVIVNGAVVLDGGETVAGVRPGRFLRLGLAAA